MPQFHFRGNNSFLSIHIMIFHGQKDAKCSQLQRVHQISEYKLQAIDNTLWLTYWYFIQEFSEETKLLQLLAFTDPQSNGFASSSFQMNSLCMPINQNVPMQ